MDNVVYLFVSLLCLGILQSLSPTPLTYAPTVIKPLNDSWNETDQRSLYALPNSAEIDQSQFPVQTTPEPISPTPPDGYWYVTDGNVTCIRARLKIRFRINTGNETKYLVLPPNADASKSSCKTSQKDQTLSLHVDKEFDLNFTFEKISEESYILKNTTLTLFSPEGESHFYNDIKLFSVQKHSSYWCKSFISVSMENVSMESFEMRFQAFGGNEKHFSAAEICPDDDELSKIVTIVVACIIAALFIIILIACNVQYRRTLRGSDSIRLIQKKATSSKSNTP